MILNKLGYLNYLPYLCNLNKKNMLKKFKTTEILILAITIIVIFFSEYLYLVEGDVNKAIFIGLWPPTIIGLLNYFNSKTKK
jgi:NADH:ubiquinone oxidoreductase subunit K